MEQLSQKIRPAQEKLERFISLLRQWQKSVNLISNNDLNDVWNRHVLDSAQLYFLLSPACETLVDFGSGGGFPGLITAILNYSLNGPVKNFYLVESNIKKCVFLQEAAREIGISVHVKNQRIESVSDIKADVITARGLASVSQILKWGKIFEKEKTTFLLLKGEKVFEELKEIDHSFQIELIENVLNSKGCIVKITKRLHE